MLFKVGDRVICRYVGRETTSSHLQIGDIGTVKHVFSAKEGGNPPCYPTEYLVDFMTSDGYKRQWVYGHTIASCPVEETELLDRIVEVESELGRLRNELNALYA